MHSVTSRFPAEPVAGSPVTLDYVLAVMEHTPTVLRADLTSPEPHACGSYSVYLATSLAGYPVLLTPNPNPMDRRTPNPKPMDRRTRGSVRLPPTPSWRCNPLTLTLTLTLTLPHCPLNFDPSISLFLGGLLLSASSAYR